MRFPSVVVWVRRVVLAVSGLALVSTAATHVAAGVPLDEPSNSVALDTSSDWVWPLDPVPDVIHAFDPPDEPWQAGNRGVDLLGAPAQPVMAIHAGVVTFAGPLAGRGVVVVSHGELRSTYEPVTAAVDVGDQVGAGTVIGLLQTTRSHCAPLTCLHLGLLRGVTYLDPLRVLGPRPVRLKSLTSPVPSSQALPPSRTPARPGSTGVGGAPTRPADVARGMRAAVAAVVLALIEARPG
jgi:murein DD-endopeptidase MepM/ murein hydrolase activator NlpD